MNLWYVWTHKLSLIWGVAVPVQNKKELKSAEWCLHRDTYSADEWGLYYDLLPNGTLTRKNDLCMGRKRSAVCMCRQFGQHKTYWIDCCNLLVPMEIKSSPVCRRHMKKHGWCQNCPSRNWRHSMQKSGFRTENLHFLLITVLHIILSLKW